MRWLIVAVLVTIGCSNPTPPRRHYTAEDRARQQRREARQQFEEALRKDRIYWQQD